MEMDMIAAIGSVGFPIVACCAMFYLYNNTVSSLITSLQKMDKTLDKICDVLSIEKEVDNARHIR